MTARSGCFSVFLLKEIKVVKCSAGVLLLSLRSWFSLAPATQLLPHQNSTHIYTLCVSLVLMFKTHPLYKKVASGLPETWSASWKIPQQWSRSELEAFKNMEISPMLLLSELELVAILWRELSGRIKWQYTNEVKESDRGRRECAPSHGS